ncbi:MAG: hypothetical protein IJC16_00200 [Rikenellaceae bacterium]|nr:hypothetical protein [Rikenellaceae bacterium]
MSFTLSCRIIIGQYEFRYVAETVIEQSRKQMGDRATIVLPSRYKSQFLCNLVKGGDPVIIGLGYDGRIEKEFEGYVSDVSYRQPVQIQCEDGMYIFKRRTPKARSWSSVKLAEVLRYLVGEVELFEVPDITLSPFAIKPGGSVYAVLQQIRDKYGLEIFFRDGKLVVTVPTYADSRERVRYDLERNVIDPSLTFRRVDDVRIRVKAVSILPGNKRLTVDVGDMDAASTTTLHFYNVTVEAELRRLASDKLRNLKYDGFSGTLTTFGLPRARKGMIAEIRDARFDGSRSGAYQIDAVKQTFGRGGYRREVSLGRRVDSNG